MYSVDRLPAPNAENPANPHGTTLPPVTMPAESGEADPHAGMPILKGPEFSDEAPAHWTEKKRTAMRMASYEVRGEDGVLADISFTSLRSAPGGLLANLNRWRNQVGLADLDDAAMGQNSVKVPSVFGEATLIDVQGLIENADPKADGRIIGAIAERDGRAWFFKMRGNDELLGREKENFIRWIASLKPLEEVVAIPAAVTPKDLSWSLPEGWVAEYGSGNRFATVKLPVEGVELAVSWFPGDVGGDAANINRWRSQIGLPALPDAEALALMGKKEAGPKTMSYVDLAGPEKRMLAAWTRHGENTWFFKLSGTKSALDECQEPFSALLSSVRFNAAQP